MELTYSDLDDGVRKITLVGRLDIEGAEAIDLRFTALAATAQNFVIVDMPGVEFLASIGISTLMSTTRAIRLRKGNLVVLNPRPNVSQVLTTMRIDQIIKVCRSLDEARLVVRAEPSPLA